MLTIITPAQLDMLDEYLYALNKYRHEENLKQPQFRVLVQEKLNLSQKTANSVADCLWNDSYKKAIQHILMYRYGKFHMLYCTYNSKTLW